MRVLNPLASVRSLRENGRSWVEIAAPVEGEGRRCTRVEFDPVLLRILEELSRGARSAIPKPWARILEDAGILIDVAKVPHEPVLRNELPLDRVPRGRSNRPVRRAGAVPNPSLEFSRTPGDVRPMVSIRDPATGLSASYSLRGRYRNALHRLLTPDPPLDGFSDRSFDILSRAHLIVGKDFISRRTEHRRRTVRRARRQLRQRGYAVIPDLVHPFQIAALRAYARDFVRGGHCENRGRDTAQDPPAFRTLHRELTGFVARVAGELVTPTYCLLASYPRGASLPKHCDQIRCLWTVSLAIDYEPDCDRKAAWPLVLHVGSRRAAVRLGMGDGVLYDGCRIPHLREPLRTGRRATFILLHYVPVELRGVKWVPEI